MDFPPSIIGERDPEAGMKQANGQSHNFFFAPSPLRV